MGTAFKDTSPRLGRPSFDPGRGRPRFLSLVQAVLCVFFLSTAGCLAPRPTLETDLSTPGWKTREGQAIWQPPEGKSEIAGELFIATHPSGDMVVQFIKTPFPLVTAHRRANRWQVSFGAQSRTISGRGTPPARFIWFHLPACIESGTPPPLGWSYQPRNDGRWHFEHKASGETLEGYLRP